MEWDGFRKLSKERLGAVLFGGLLMFWMLPQIIHQTVGFCYVQCSTSISKGVRSHFVSAGLSARLMP